MNVKGLMMSEHISTYYFVAGDYIKDTFFTLNRFLKTCQWKNNFDFKKQRFGVHSVTLISHTQIYKTKMLKEN